MSDVKDDGQAIQRWTAKPRVALVVQVVKGELSVVEAARRHGLTVAEVEAWKDKFLLGAENALRSRPKDEEALKEEESKRLKQKVGELVLDNDILKEAVKRTGPLAQRMFEELREEVPRTSERRLCRVLGVSRSLLQVRSRQEAREPMVDGLLSRRIQQVLEQFPTFGYRRIGAILRYRDGLKLNPKAGYRVLKLKGWLVHQRSVSARPRVSGRRSRTEASNARWAMDVTHIDCGDEGWGHLSAVIDCHNREIVGPEFALRARAREAERALEGACTERPSPVRRGVHVGSI